MIQNHQHHVPDLEHALLFLNHDRVQERRSNQPWHQRGILDRIPTPEAAPAQFVIRPLAAQQNSNAQKHPGHHGPPACRANPSVAKLLGEHRRHGEREWNRKAHEAQIQHGRMDHHVGILKQRIETAPVGGHKRDGRRLRLQNDGLIEWIHRKQMHGCEEQRCRHQHRGDVGHHGAVFAPVLNDHQRRINRQQPAPEEQRPFLAAPNGADLEVDRQVAIGMRGDVFDGKVADREQIAEANDSRRDARECAQRGVASAGDQLRLFETDP